MSQPTNWGVPRTDGGNEYTPEQFAERADESFDALLSLHKGNSRPAYAEAGTLWLDDSATPWALKIFDGSDDITINTIDPTGNVSRSADGFPADTVMLFYQASAPTGWTKLTTHNNKALRVVSGTGGGSGGSVAFTTAFASNRAVSGTVAAHVLTTDEIPAHFHGAGTLTAASAGAHTHPIRTRVGGTAGQGDSVARDAEFTLTTSNTAIESAGNHTHTITGNTASAGGGQGHNHGWSGSVNLAVQYIDVILAKKD